MVFRYDRWTVKQQKDGIFALYEDALYGKQRVCKSYHHSLSGAVGAITGSAIAEDATTDQIWSLWDSVGKIYEGAGDYART